MMTNKEFCKIYGISMSELARRADVSRSTLYDVDCNRYNTCRSRFKIIYARHLIEREKLPKKPNKGLFVNAFISFILFLILVIMLVLI